MPSKITLEFSIELDYFDRRAAREAARSSGRTSIRVSKSTLAALRELAKKVRDVGIGARAAKDVGNTYYSSWRAPEPPPDQLIAAIAAGVVSRHAVPDVRKRMPRPRRSPKKKHASKRSRKGMPRRPRRKVRR